MTKADIIDRIASGTGLTKVETEAVVNGFFTTVMQALLEGDRVELRGFGSFRVQQRAARTTLNPQTGEPIDVPMRYVPVFRAAKEFRARVDEETKARHPEG